MKSSLKKTRDYMFKRCYDLLSSALSYLNQMQNAVDIDYNEDAERIRFDYFRRISDAFNWLNYSYIHNSDMLQEFAICSSLFSDIYKMFYNFKF